MPVNRPNVVFIMADQHRWDFMSYESNGRTFTPNLESIGHSGTIFRAAYCPAPLCSPSREAIAAGRDGVSTGCFTNLHQLPPGTPTFVSQLRNAGYRTSAIGKTHMEIHAYDADYTSAPHKAFMYSLGWDEVCEVSGNGMFYTGIRCAYSEFLRAHGMLESVTQFYDYWGYFLDKRGKPRGHGAQEWPYEEKFQETAFIGTRAIEWLENYDEAAPFFLHVGFAGPHSPIEPFPSYMDLYRQIEEPRPWGVESAPEWRADWRRGYRAMISQIDHYVGLIRDCLERKGILDNTVIVYTSDHGEMAGDHGRDGKTCFFEGSARVPLLMAGPGIKAGNENSSLVELLGIGKTICELCLVEPHHLDQGRSLLPLLNGTDAKDFSSVYCEMGCDRMVRTDRYKLMYGDPHDDKRGLGMLHLDKPVNIPASPPKLYDLQNDPQEMHNLWADPQYDQQKIAMLELLLARINEATRTEDLKSRGEYKPLL